MPIILAVRQSRIKFNNMAKAKKPVSKKKSVVKKPVVEKETKVKVEIKEAKSTEVKAAPSFISIPYVPRKIDRVPPPKK
jgi:hypothetical protein